MDKETLGVKPDSVLCARKTIIIYSPGLVPPDPSVFSEVENFWKDVSGKEVLLIVGNNGELIVNFEEPSVPQNIPQEINHRP